MMKNIIYRCYLMILIFIFFASKSFAADSSINITGSVADNTCAVSPSSDGQIVDFLNESIKSLNAVNKTSLAIPFYIELFPCGTAVTGVKVGFTGIADSSNTSLLALENIGGAASGVGIQILDKARNPLSLNDDNQNIPWTSLTTGSRNTLNFYARLMVTELPVNAGKIRATATFTLEYQ
ncbi:fimbrial protein [Providencia stuartii]